MRRRRRRRRFWRALNSVLYLSITYGTATRVRELPSTQTISMADRAEMRNILISGANTSGPSGDVTTASMSRMLLVSHHLVSVCHCHQSIEKYSNCVVLCVSACTLTGS